MQDLSGGSAKTCHALSSASSQSSVILKGILKGTLTVKGKRKARAEHDCFPEERILCAAKRYKMMHDGTSTSRLTPRRDLGLVSPYKADVVLDPLQDRALVVETSIR